MNDELLILTTILLLVAVLVAKAFPVWYKSGEDEDVE